MVGSGIRFHPAYGRVHVFDGLGEAELRRQPVIDAEPGEARLRERLEQGTDVRALAALIEASAMDKYRCWKRARTVGNVQVEEQRLPARVAIFNVFLVDVSCRQEWCSDCQNECELPHGGELYQSRLKHLFTYL